MLNPTIQSRSPFLVERSAENYIANRTESLCPLIKLCIFPKIEIRKNDVQIQNTIGPMTPTDNARINSKMIALA
jgi:hypothetical protein